MFKLKKKILICIAIVTVLTVGIFFYSQQQREIREDVLAAGESWLSSWDYRKPVTITASGTLTNYQVKATVAYVSSMNSDFSDLRFTSSDGSTLLDYWIESYTASSSATVWVEVPSIATTATIYMYYGNSSATSLSSGDNTFTFFDGFEGSSLDTTKWDGDTAAGTVSGGNLILTGNNTVRYLTSIQEISYPATIVFKGSLAANGYDHFIGLTDAARVQTYEIRWYAGGMNTSYLSRMYTANGSPSYVTTTNAAAGLSEFMIKWTSGSVAWYRDGVQQTSSPVSSPVPSIALPVVLRPYDVVSSTFDFILVRGYAATEPTVVLGAEEAEPTDCLSASGITCTQTTDGSYTINTYTLTSSSTASTTWTPPTGVTSVQYLVVAGGGSGGSWVGGGGGAGGLLTNYGTGSLFVSGSYTITVGAGGASVTSAPGNNGSNSSIGSLVVATGGGGGGGGDTSQAVEIGKSGGSGGGGGYYTSAAAGGSGVSGQGYAGGSGVLNGEYYGGGGGGAGAVGATAVSGAGAGGAGLSNSITGSAVYYAGGGGGGSWTTGGGAGGTGGGGAGSTSTSGVGTAGTNGLGGGGGGTRGQTASGAGGNGVIIIRYALSAPSSGSTFTVKKEDGCSCTMTNECYSGECNGNVCGAEVHTSTNLTCYITSGACDGTVVFNLYDKAGGHAEIPSLSNYSNKVCCTGTGISNTCTGYYDTVLSLYSQTNSHVEKDTESNYTNDVCLHSDSIPVTCNYSTDCSLLGSEYVCLASISGNTDAHVGGCSVYSNKVCCMIGVVVDNCLSKVVSDKSIALKNTDIQFCSGADITNEADPCYDVCWKGTGSPNLNSSDWKCSVCHDPSNNHVSCSTLTGTTYSWVMPTGYALTTDYTLIGSSTLTSANPIIRFVNSSDNRVVRLNMVSLGTTCSGQNAPRVLPNWKEISPF